MSCLFAKTIKVAPTKRLILNLNWIKKNFKFLWEFKKNKINYFLPLLAREHAVLIYNRSFLFCRHYQQPKQVHPWSQNSFSNTNAKTFDHQHPRHLAYNFKNKFIFIKDKANNYQIFSKQKKNYFLCSKVLILKPSVGEMVSISSPLYLFKIVVLPALSKPLVNTRNNYWI